MEVIKKTILQALTTGLTQGFWNAETNVPDITTTVEIGYMWYVSVSGNTLLGEIDEWNVGDWAVKSTGSTWGKVINGLTTCTGCTGMCRYDIPDRDEYYIKYGCTKTVIIPDLNAVYYMKIGLTQDTLDVGFLDAYVESETLPPET